MGAPAFTMFEGGLFTKGKSKSLSNACTSCPSKALCETRRPSSASAGDEASSWELTARPQSTYCGTMAWLSRREPFSACVRSFAGRSRSTTRSSAGPAVYMQQRSLSALKMQVRLLRHLAQNKNDLLAASRSAWRTGWSTGPRLAAKSATQPETSDGASQAGHTPKRVLSATEISSAALRRDASAWSVPRKEWARGILRLRPSAPQRLGRSRGRCC